MDKLKTRVLFISLIILALVSISAVAAADGVNDEIISANQEDFDLSEETNDVEQLGANVEDDIVNDQSAGNQVLKASDTELLAADEHPFSELQELIINEGSGGFLELSNNYTFTADDKPIVIPFEFTIDGKGHTLDANHLNGILTTNSKVTLKNIVFINGNRTSQGSITYDGSVYYLYGGALTLYDGAGSTIENCIFEDNYAFRGAAIYWRGNDSTLKNSNFTDNYAKGYGGAIYYDGANSVIEYCNFTSNVAELYDGGAIYYASNAANPSIKYSSFSKNNASAQNGGAICFESGNATVENSNFTDNYAEEFGGAIYWNGADGNLSNSRFENNLANPDDIYSAHGGAIYWSGENGSIKESNFTSNAAGSMGGAISNPGGGLSIADSSFSKNNASYGGALDAGADCTIENSNFTDNYANYYGGAICSYEKNAIIDTCNFISNEVELYGGAIYFAEEDANQSISNSLFCENTASIGGAIDCKSEVCKIDHCNFTSNMADGNGGAINFETQQSPNTNHTITNSNFTKNSANDYGSGGAIMTINATTTIDNCIFEENTADASGGAIDSKNNALVNITNAKFNKNQCLDPYSSEGGAIYFDSSSFYIDNTEFTNNSAYNGGAFTIDQHDHTEAISNLVVNTNFTENKATFFGGAVSTESDNLTFDHCQFEKNSAANGGAIESIFNPANTYVSNSEFNENSASYGGALTIGSGCVIDDSNFTGNNASYGGSLYIIGSDNSIENSNFTGNNASYYGGAILNDGTGNIIDESTFNYNKASYGSAIFSGLQNSASSFSISNSELLDNLANANSLNVTAEPGDSSFTVDIHTTFKGNDVLLNAIYSRNLAVTFKNVSYWGFEGKIMNTGDEEVKPVAYANASEDGKLVYWDTREAGINITVSIYDENGEFIMNITNMTDIYGDINASGIELKPGKYKAKAIHKLDTYYTEIIGETEFEIPKEPSTVNGTNVTEVYGEPIVVTVASENATAVIYNITDDITGQVVVGNTQVAANGDFTVPMTLDPGNYTVHYLTVVDDVYYNTATNTSKITIQKIDVIVTVDKVINYTGAVVDVIANVTGVDGKNITGGFATYIIHYDNKIASGLLMAAVKEYTAEVIDGKAVFEGIILGAPGTYPSTIEYSGNEHYNAANNKSEVIVLPLNTTTESDDVSGSSGDKVDIVAEIVDQNGNPVQNGTAVLKLNGKEYKAEVKDGKATFKGVELPSESTEATIDYLGNDYYNPSKTTIQITINEEPEPEPEPQPEPVTPVAEKTVPAIPAAGNPIAIVVLALLTLVSTVSFGRKK